MREFKNEREVEELWTEHNQKVVLFEGSVYDVTDYTNAHPGGASLISDNYGKNIDEAYEEANHSKAARLIFRDLPLVGYIAGAKDNQESAVFAGTQQTSTFKLDLHKPVVMQIL